MTASPDATPTQTHGPAPSPAPTGHPVAAGAGGGSHITTPPAILTRALVKTYGDHRAVDGIDLVVPRGAVYGFLGPNGSGKTTTIRMLLGLIRPASGEIEMLGRPMPAESARVLPRVGSLVEGPAFHPHLTGRANLRRLDAVDAEADPTTSRARIEAALGRVGLLAAAGKRYRAYSLGMKQRLAIAAALLAERDLLILDEPTNGLDPQGTREIRHLMAALAADGVTVLVSSHLLSEIEQVCTHLGVMRDGSLVAQGTVDEIRALAPTQIRVTTRQPQDAADVLGRLGLAGIETGTSASGEGIVVASSDGAAPEDVVDRLVRAGVGVRGFEIRPPRLEDLFVSLTGEGFDVGR